MRWKLFPNYSSQEHRVSSPQDPVSGLFSGRNRALEFFILPQATCCSSKVLCTWEGSFLLSPVLTYGMEILPWLYATENTRDLIALISTHRQCFHSKKGKSRKLEITASRLLEWSHHSERSALLSPLLAPDPRLQRFCMGEAGKTNSSSSLPKETDFIFNRKWRNSSLNLLSKTGVHYGER